LHLHGAGDGGQATAVGAEDAVLRGACRLHQEQVCGSGRGRGAFWMGADSLNNRIRQFGCRLSDLQSYPTLSTPVWYLLLHEGAGCPSPSPWTSPSASGRWTGRPSTCRAHPACVCKQEQEGQVTTEIDAVINYLMRGRHLGVLRSADVLWVAACFGCCSTCLPACLPACVS